VRPSRLSVLTLAAAVLVLLVVAVGATLIGAAGLGWTRVARELLAQLTGGTSPLSEQEAAIIWQLRVPRVVLAGLVGAALAVAGAAFQGVFRNPLADPYLLGAAAGAGMAATVVVVAAPASPGWVVDPLPLAAFAGALGGVGLSWLLGRSAGGGTAVLLLAGIAVAAFLTAVQTFAQQLNTDTIEQVYTWMLGGLTTAGWHEVLLTLPYIGSAAVVLCLAARLLDVLAVGDDEAASLGVRPGRVRLVVLLAASLATAAAVAVSGLLGVVGIVVPRSGSSPRPSCPSG
jgi:iron complex transport system permease protein